LPENLPSFYIGCGSMVPNSNGQRRLLISLIKDKGVPADRRERTSLPGRWREIAPGFAVLERAKRASHIDPPTSSYAIMRRARPYRGENHGPARMFKESLT
jgi:hypothetical protein